MIPLVDQQKNAVASCAAATGAFQEPADDLDLKTQRAIRNPYVRRSIETTRETVYDGPDQEAAA